MFSECVLNVDITGGNVNLPTTYESTAKSNQSDFRICEILIVSSPHILVWSNCDRLNVIDVTTLD